MGRPRPRLRAPSFSSADYWARRFASEKSFEWLLPSSLLVPTILDVFRFLLRADSIDTHAESGEVGQGAGQGEGRTYHVLHFGCGTSSLGADLQAALDNELGADRRRPAHSAQDGPHRIGRSPAPSAPAPAQLSARPRALVVDADYVASALPARDRNGCPDRDGEAAPPLPPLVQMDMLSPSSLARSVSRDAAGQVRGWDLVVDKSTADAISTGPSAPASVPVPDPGAQVEIEEEGRGAEGGEGQAMVAMDPVERLARGLAGVVRPGGRWVCVSFSQTRFADLHAGWGWTLVDQRWVALPSEDHGRPGQPKVYTPEVKIVIYILARV